jgi:hypothetical protein
MLQFRPGLPDADTALLRASDQAARSGRTPICTGDAAAARAEEIARVAQALTGSLDVGDIAQRIVSGVLPVLRVALPAPPRPARRLVMNPAQGPDRSSRPYGHVTRPRLDPGRAVVDGHPWSPPTSGRFAYPAGPEMRGVWGSASGLSRSRCVRRTHPRGGSSRTGQVGATKARRACSRLRDQAALALITRACTRTRQRLRHPVHPEVVGDPRPLHPRGQLSSRARRQSSAGDWPPCAPEGKTS